MLGRTVHQRGDTMIEVLVAVAVFSVVAVAGLAIMNHGAASAQRALEVGLVRNEIDAQAEALRMLYDDAVAARSMIGGGGDVSGQDAISRWEAVLAKRKASATDYHAMVQDDGISCVSPSQDQAFVIDPVTGALIEPPSGWSEAPLYSRVLRSDSGNISVEGLWIEAVGRNATIRDGVTLPGYTDFHIRACWSSVGQSVPVTTGTIVRLYEP